MTTTSAAAAKKPPSARISGLTPRTRDPEVLAKLRAEWDAKRRVRIEDALMPDLAEAIVEASATAPFSFFEKHVNEVRCVFWRQVQLYPGCGEKSSFAPMPQMRRLFESELPELATEITGQPLWEAESDGFAIDYYTRGSYLDAHTDQGADRLIAFVIGLTRETWPAEDGGHLEFLEADERTVVDRVAPGWCSIDLFCIYPLLRPHRVPLLKRPVQRLTINGWLSGELRGPGER